MADNTQTPTVNIGNPGPLGLFAFGMTTFLLALHNLGLIQMDSVILAMGLFYGGLAQIIAGLFEYKRGNTFTATAFTSYGFFWLSFVIIALGHIGESQNAAMGAYFIVWGLFTLIFFAATLKRPVAIRIVFLTLILLFIAVGAHKFIDSIWIGYIAGLIGFICGLSAIYAAAGEMLNAEYGKDVLPLG